jgi:DNA polymerase III delta subunit
MIYFYYGTDREKIQKTARATFDALKKKKPDASSVSFDTETFTADLLQEISVSQGLFEKKIVAKLSNILEDKDKAEIILDTLKAMKETENIIVWSEGEVNKAPLEKIKKYAEKVEEFGVKQKAEKKFPSIFKMTDAIGDKDKKTAWGLLVEEMQNGTASEEIHGTIFWQIKSIAIAKKTDTAEESGINPFVYGKAKNFARNWSDEELNGSITELVDMYHRAHRGEVDFEVELERWVLKI